ncbi:hypothetical protein E4U55_007642 [Claviceps digitariae]|nr:hypothetical protein E4U55_007642 [Claviceps digitariae]
MKFISVLGGLALAALEVSASPIEARDDIPVNPPGWCCAVFSSRNFMRPMYLPQGGLEDDWPIQDECTVTATPKNPTGCEASNWTLQLADMCKYVFDDSVKVSLENDIFCKGVVH